MNEVSKSVVHRGRWRRLVHGLVRIALLMSLVVLVTCAWLAATQTGLRVLVGLISSSTDKIRVEAVEGRLIGPFSVRGLSWITPEQHVDIDQLALQWQPAALLRGELLIDSLQCNGVRLLLDGTTSPPDDSAPTQLPESLVAPLDMHLRAAGVHSFTYQRGATTLFVEQISLSANWVEDQLNIDAFKLLAGETNLDMSGAATLAGDYVIDASGSAVARLEGLANIQSEWSAGGSLRALEIDARIDSPYATTLTGTLSDLLDTPTVRAEVRIAEAQLHEIAPQLPKTALAGHLSVMGPFTNLQSTGRITSDGGDYSAAIEYVASLNGNRVRLERFLVFSDDQAQPLLATGVLELGAGLKADLSISGEGVDPAFYAAYFGQPKLAQNLSGTLELQAQMRVEQTAAGALSVELPEASLTGVLLEQPLSVQATVSYSDTALEARVVSLQWGKNTANVSGRIADDADLHWQFDAADLALFAPLVGEQLSGEVSAAGEVQGSRTRPRLVGSVTSAGIEYADTLLQQVAAEFSVGLDTNDPLRLSFAATDLEVSGQAIRSVDLQAQGNGGAHRFTAKLDSELFAASFSGDGALLPRPGPNPQPIQQSDQYQWEFALDALELEHVPSEPSRGSDSAARSAWHRWLLDGTASGQVAADEVALSEFCLEHAAPEPGGRVCLAAQQHAVGLVAQGRLHDIQLAFFEGLIPPDLRLSGAINGEFDWQGELFNSRIALTTTAIEVASPRRDQDTLLRFAPGRIDLFNNDRSAQVNVELPLQTPHQTTQPPSTVEPRDSAPHGLYGSIAWTMPQEIPTPGKENGLTNRTPNKQAVLEDLPMLGELRFNLSEFDWLAELVPGAPKFAGQLAGRFTLAGRLAAPMIEGEAQFRAQRVAIEQLDIELEDLMVDLQMRETRGNATGQLRSGAGELRFQGSLDWTQTLQGELALSGQDFLLSDTATAVVRVTPDLQARFVDQSLNLTGSMRLPTAQIHLRSVPAGGVSVSADQQIVGEDRTTEELPIEVNADLLLSLGDEVSFSGLGLESTLRGELRVKERPDSPTTATGEIEIVTGSYKAYGQDMTVERGRVVFVGGPVTEPGLDIRATRRATPDVLVGVNVAGTLSGPDLQVFSEPALPQSDQLSYLILGRPIVSNSSAENTLLQQAAMAIGVKGGELVTDRLSKKVGLDTLGIESEPGESNAQAALVIGKYLSPRLYVSYGYGLFNPISTLNMEYQFSELWRIVTRSTNEATGGDVQWVLER